MASGRARVWFAVTALCVLVGVSISIATAATSSVGHFPTATERGLNTLAFFTTDSNLIVGGVCGLLAWRVERSSTLFAMARLTSIVAITVTGLVYHVALAQLSELQGWHQLGNQLVHTVVPVLAVLGWLLYGPRRLTALRIAAGALAFPVAWLIFTLLRGAFVNWYPYPFLDVTRLGYGGALVNCVWVALLFFALAAGAGSIDRALTRRAAS